MQMGGHEHFGVVELLLRNKNTGELEEVHFPILLAEFESVPARIATVLNRQIIGVTKFQSFQIMYTVPGSDLKLEVKPIEAANLILKGIFSNCVIRRT